MGIRWASSSGPSRLVCPAFQFSLKLTFVQPARRDYSISPTQCNRIQVGCPMDLTTNFLSSKFKLRALSTSGCSHMTAPVPVPRVSTKDMFLEKLIFQNIRYLPSEQMRQFFQFFISSADLLALHPLLQGLPCKTVQPESRAPSHT